MWSSCTDDALSGSEPAKNGHVHTPQLVDSGVVANVLRLRVRSPPQAEKDLLLLRGVFQYMHVLHSQRPQLACHHVRFCQLLVVQVLLDELTCVGIDDVAIAHVNGGIHEGHADRAKVAAGREDGHALLFSLGGGHFHFLRIPALTARRI